MSDVRWLAVCVGVGGSVAVAYLLTHPYPAYGAGLYLQMAEQILAGGYRLPTTVSYYTAQGVPFAYPPLVFYASAFLHDVVGIGLVPLSRYVPAVLTVVYLIPYYFVARELLDSRREAGVATVLLAVSPPTLQWHLSAGGLVRATGFLFALTGVYAGVRLFRSKDRRWLVPATLLFGLTVLTHPVYTVFFGLSYVLLFVAFDRSFSGLVAGGIVALGGVVLASPWWTRIVRRHGVGVFAAAAGTHTGLFGGSHRLVDQFVYPLVMEPPVPLFFVLSFAGMFYLLGRRRFFLPAWLVASAMVVGKERFQFVAGSMMAAAFLVAATRRIARDHAPAIRRRSVVRGALAAVVLAAVTVGVLFGAAALPTAHHGSPSQPAFMDQSDERAMVWVTHNTSQSADFVVLGDAAEWFPLFTQRTILVGPWGVEWTSPDRYDSQLSQYRNLSTCTSERCVTRGLARANLRPEYVYVPKGSYTVRGLREGNSTALHRSLKRSERYRPVYENEGVVIYRVVADGYPNSRAAVSTDTATKTATMTVDTVPTGSRANGPTSSPVAARTTTEPTARARKYPTAPESVPASSVGSDQSSTRRVVPGLRELPRSP
jgi:hypothetical protein